MAGPGGGPPRRSHTKSRKGCEACKKRHIRCDESFPQCRNCTKHKIRCPYNEITNSDDRPMSAGDRSEPDMMWLPEIQQAIIIWKCTSVFPFPLLQVHNEPSPAALSDNELRLLYHVASICDQVRATGAVELTLWTRHIPAIISIAADNRFVMDALLAFSASHMSSQNGCPLVGYMADEYRGQAMTGLQSTLRCFCKANSDAALAGSLILSWQAADWATWSMITKGTNSIAEEMAAWKEESEFRDLIADVTSLPSPPASPEIDPRTKTTRKEDNDTFQCTIQQLQKTEAFLKQNKVACGPMTQLIIFVKGARKEHNTPLLQQYARLRCLRDWLFWTPIQLLKKDPSMSSPTLVTMGHLYAVALVMRILFPEIGAAFFGNMAIGPLLAIEDRLHQKIGTRSPTSTELDKTSLALFRFAGDMVVEYRGRHSPPPSALVPQLGAATDTSSFYSVPYSVPPMTTVHTPLYSMPMYSDSHLHLNSFCHSSEDLSSVVALDHRASHGSLYQGVPPYPATQYLGVPSPTRTGYSCSPASSNYGDMDNRSSVAYSDTDDLSNYDFSYHPATTTGAGYPPASATYAPATTSYTPPTAYAQYPFLPVAGQSPNASHDFAPSQTPLFALDTGLVPEWI